MRAGRMETRAAALDAIRASDLRCWHAMMAPGDENQQPAASGSANTSSDMRSQLARVSLSADAIPFRVDAAINQRVALWNGQLWRLQIDAIVNSTSESLQDTTGLCRKILDAAGKEFWTECESAEQCRTGDAVVTRGCRLPAKKIIHTVGPRYNLKYHNAAEHALHMCYRSVLSAAVEERLRSVAFPCIYTKKKGYPRDEAAHIAARTVRRFLEHYRDKLDLVVFVVDTLEDQLFYEAILPLYFPRNDEEERTSVGMLASRQLGNAFGEPVIAERKIRIGAIHAKANASNQSEDDDHAMDPEEDDLTDDEDDAVQRFCEMTVNPDVERLAKLKRLQEERRERASRMEHEKMRVLNYQSALTKAQHEDFSDLKQLKFLYRGGVDHSGAPVMVYMASNLSIADVDLDRVMLFIIQTMDNVVESKYSVLYVHSGTSDENQPNAAWLKRLFSTFSTKYQQNLMFFYIFEPTIWLRLLLALAKGFVSSAFYKRIAYVSSSAELLNIASSLDLPEHIFPYVVELRIKPPEQAAYHENEDEAVL